MNATSTLPAQHCTLTYFRTLVTSADTVHEERGVAKADSAATRIRSIARLMAAYAWAPLVRMRMEPVSWRATVTVQATPPHPPQRSRARSTTRACRTFSADRASAANTRYSAYVRVCELIESPPRTSMRIAAIALRKAKGGPAHLRGQMRLGGSCSVGRRVAWVSKRNDRFRMKGRTASSFSTA